MNKDIIQGNWQQVKGKIRAKWGELTDNDVAQMKGTYQELEGLLQERYGYEKDRAKKELDSFIDSNHWH